jgi:hypothetical protein
VQPKFVASSVVSVARIVCGSGTMTDGSESSAVVIDASIQPRQVSKRIVRRASVPHEPIAKRCQRDQVVIAADDAQAGNRLAFFVRLWLPPIRQPSRHATGVEVHLETFDVVSE